MSLKETKNYLWSTNNQLGIGATATVYRGVCKTNGESVAVKTLKYNECRLQEMQIRELEVLQRVNHENVVKLLAFEEEQISKKKVIIMELCAGGSLCDILMDPENTLGLEDSEFLLILQHLYAGMKHLRANNLIHRDLKPGNIMKFIRDDGTAVYKLTDFGTARELQEGQQFESIHGTEEYLFPDMYRRAFLRKQLNQKFGATVDLWSIGATLYHVATGQVPFRPYGGRKNKETMHLITTKKESGVISGVQTREGGSIKWSKELPVNCQLSGGLKKVITPLLAALLEDDQEKIWCFDKFFSEVEVILSRRPLHIFHVNKAQLITMYILPDEAYRHLHECIAEQTQIEEKNQILIYQSTLYSSFIAANTKAVEYPTTTKEEPIFLFDRENNNVSIDPEPKLREFTDFHHNILLLNDANKAKMACDIAHQHKRHIEKYSLYCKLINSTVDNLTKFIVSELKRLHKDTQHLVDKISIFKKLSQVLALMQYNTDNNHPQMLDNIWEQFTETVVVNVDNLYDAHCTGNWMRSQWDTMSENIKCPYKNSASAKAKTHVLSARDSWKRLLKDLDMRMMSQDAERFHSMQRLRITATVRSLEDLLKREVFPEYKQLTDKFGDWYKTAQNIHLKMEILVSDVSEYEKKLKHFEENLSTDNKDFVKQMETNLQNKKFEMFLMNRAEDRKDIKAILKDNFQARKKINQLTTSLNHQLKKRLKDYSKESDNIKKILCDNAEMNNKLTKMTLELGKM